MNIKQIKNENNNKIPRRIRKLLNKNSENFNYKRSVFNATIKIINIPNNKDDCIKDDNITIDNYKDNYTKYIELYKKCIKISIFEFRLFQRIVYEGDYYAFLMVHFRNDQKKDTFVGISKNPIRSWFLHNNGIIDDKETKSAKGYWKLSHVIGPLQTQDLCLDCALGLVQETRGVLSKQKAVSVQQIKFGAPVFSNLNKL